MGEVIFLGSVIYRKRFIWRTMEKPDGIWEERLGGGRVWWGEEGAREAMRRFMVKMRFLRMGRKGEMYIDWRENVGCVGEGATPVFSKMPGFSAKNHPLSRALYSAKVEW